MLANHREGHIRKRGIRIDLKRGEMGWSERELAKRWQWSRDKVRRYLNELCSENESKLIPQTSPQNKNVTSCYKIQNYSIYQDGQTTNNTTNNTTNRPQTDRKQDQNKNDKNDKNERKRILPEKFKLDSGMIQYAINKGVANDHKNIFEDFCLYHKKKGSKFVDWNAAWQTWIRNQVKWHGKGDTPKILTAADIEAMQQ